MSLSSAISAAQRRVAAAYDAARDMGATIPQTQDLAHLPDSIRSIPTGPAYQRVEYIETDGAAFFDLAQKGGSDIDAEFEFTPMARQINRALFGCFGTNAGLYIYTYTNSAYQVGLRSYYTLAGSGEDAAGEALPYLTPTPGTRTVVKWDNAAHTVTIGGHTITFAAGDYLTPFTLLAGNMYNGTGQLYQGLPLQIHAIKIWEGGALAHSWVPVRMDGAGYLLDEVTGGIHSKCGAGVITIGPDIIIP